MSKEQIVKPLFIMDRDAKNIGKHLVTFATDNYNKALGEALINAKDDAEAISSFLQEFSESPLTLKSYAKEIERLLLWCIHIAKKNISSLRRDDLVEYEVFLRNPQPKKAWVGSKATRQLKDGSAHCLIKKLTFE